MGSAEFSKLSVAFTNVHECRSQKPIPIDTTALETGSYKDNKSS